MQITLYLIQSQYTDTGPASPGAGPIPPGAWQGSYWSSSFSVTGTSRPGKRSTMKARSRPVSLEQCCNQQTNKIPKTHKNKQTKQYRRVNFDETHSALYQAPGGSTTTPPVLQTCGQGRPCSRTDTAGTQTTHVGDCCWRFQLVKVTS